MNYDQIQAILLGVTETLKLLYEQPDYQSAEASNLFNTINDVRLIDAIKVLRDISDGFADLEKKMAGEMPPNIARMPLYPAEALNSQTDGDDDIPF